MDPAPTQIRPLELTRPARTPRVADTVTHTPHSARRTPHADSTADPFHHDRSRASGARAGGESEHTGRCLVSCAVTSHCQGVLRASCIMHARTAPAPSR